jgi:membrane protease YdiL (CAAX protease family)
MQGFAAMVKNRWFPLIMTSILFGLMHSFNPEVKEFGFFTMMPQYIAFG